MKFLPPRPGKSAKSTFGAARAERLNQRLNKAIAQRRQLSRAEATAPSPLTDHLQKKGEQVSRTIGRLQQELADE